MIEMDETLITDSLTAALMLGSNFYWVFLCWTVKKLFHTFNSTFNYFVGEKKLNLSVFTWLLFKDVSIYGSVCTVWNSVTFPHIFVFYDLNIYFKSTF